MFSWKVSIHLKWKIFGWNRSLLFKLLHESDTHLKNHLVPDLQCLVPQRLLIGGFEALICRQVFCLLLPSQSILFCLHIPSTSHLSVFFAEAHSCSWVASKQLRNAWPCQGRRMWTQMLEGHCLSAAFFCRKTVFHCCLLTSSTLEYAAVSPEQTPGYLGIGNTLKLSSFPV